MKCQLLFIAVCFLVFLRLRSFANVEVIRHSISHCCSHNFMCENRKTQGHRYSKAHGLKNFCWIAAKMLLSPILVKHVLA